MQWLSSLWRSEPPATVASDNIVPLHILDACWMYQRFLVAPVLRFDEALDSSKLTDALLKLIQTGDYRKLGARTRRNQVGLFVGPGPLLRRSSRPESSNIMSVSPLLRVKLFNDYADSGRLR
jgi:hypothetical protein